MSDLEMTVGLIKALAPKPDPEDVKQSVEDWLEDHPEATTTVEDGAITKAKLDSSLKGTVDDVDALKSALTELNTVGGATIPALSWTSGKYVNSSSDAITNGGDALNLSNYIEIPFGLEEIKISNIDRTSVAWTIAFYDSSKTFISGAQKPANTPPSYDYIVTTIPQTAKYFLLTHYVNPAPVADVAVYLYTFTRISGIENDIGELNTKLSPDSTYHNILAGATTFTDKKFINDQGNTVTNNNFCLIDGFFQVKPSTTYKLYRGEPSLYSNSGHNWTWWDENKTFISYQLSGSAVTSPANAIYLRFAVYISNTGSVTHDSFDATKVIITEDAKPCFNDTFIKTPARPSFNGLKWIGVGDSITEENFRATYHYWSYIQAETGITFTNMGVSGSGYKAEGSGNQAFYRRVQSMATDADVITIFGGVNDVVLSDADIGTAADTGTTTICGCVNETLDVIEELYPAHMPVGIISPLPCYCTDTTVNIHPYQRPDDDTCRMAQFVEQLALICKHRGIPFLDLFHQSNLRPWHEECNAKFFSCDTAPTGDGLHPNGYGHRLFYRQIMDFVGRIVMQ